MLITRECDYAVRVLRAMAEEKRVSVNEICEKELITAPFAYKILKKLRNQEWSEAIVVFMGIFSEL